MLEKMTQLHLGFAVAGKLGCGIKVGDPMTKRGLVKTHGNFNVKAKTGVCGAES